MRNIVWLIVVLLAMAACRQEPHYTITGKFPGMPDGLKVYLESRVGVMVPIDSAITRGEQFVFHGKMDFPRFCRIRIPDTIDKIGKEQEIWVENSDIALTCSWDSLRYNDAMVTGSVSHDLYNTLHEQRKFLYKENMNLHREYFMCYEQYAYQGIFSPEQKAAGIEVAKQQAEISRKVRELEEKFVRANPSSMVSLMVLNKLLGSDGRYSREEMQELINMIDPELKGTPEYMEVEKVMNEHLKTAKGEHFIDFTVMDKNGKEGRFSDYVQSGKYNLLECWASWCGPCRAEIPHLKHVHDICGDKFNIIAVSVDKNEAEWEKALAEERPAYLQLRNIPDAYGKRVQNYYGITGIPYTLLLDGEGRIVEAEVRGATLDWILMKLDVINADGKGLNNSK
jgi:hypothetical protein